MCSSVCLMCNVLLFWAWESEIHTRLLVVTHIKHIRNMQQHRRHTPNLCHKFKNEAYFIFSGVWVWLFVCVNILTSHSSCMSIRLLLTRRTTTALTPPQNVVLVFAILPFIAILWMLVYVYTCIVIVVAYVFVEKEKERESERYSCIVHWANANGRMRVDEWLASLLALIVRLTLRAVGVVAHFHRWSCIS